MWSLANGRASWRRGAGLTSWVVILAASLWWTLAESASKPSPAISQDWLRSIEKSIAAEEYRATWQTKTSVSGGTPGWQAPNRRQNLRTHFTPAGIRLIPRDPAVASRSVGAWEWGLDFIGVGRSGHRKRAERPSIQVEGAKVTYDRGWIREFYVNDERGLEQFFTIFSPPERSRDKIGGNGRRLSRPARASEVHVDLALTGTLSGVLSDDRRRFDFVNSRGVRVLRYDHLMVTDAHGRELRAWMEGFTERGVRGIRLVFDDEGAIYPVTVDPLTSSAVWTADSDQAGSHFGRSVATAGDVNGDGFSDVVVGAYFYDNGQTDEGVVFVFHGSASGLSTSANTTLEDDQAGAYFGDSVATAGDVDGDGYSDVIVGAPHHDAGETDEGGAFVYSGSPTGVDEVAAWKVDIDQTNAYFGWQVAPAGDVNGDGYSDVVVSAPWFDNGQTDEGRVYVYHGGSTGLSESAAVTAESNQASAQFGFSVATAGDANGDGYSDVIVGANLYDNGQTDEGRASLFLGSSGGVSGSASWTAESDQASAHFGRAVATAGDVNGDGYSDAIVGAWNYDNGQTDEGRAYIYHGVTGSVGLGTSSAWTTESNQASAKYGISVATAGDVNGDGYADVVVGASLYDNGESDEGRAFVYLGSGSGASTTPVWSAESDQASALFGACVAPAGDVNGDGFGDLIVGAQSYDDGQTDEGAAFVYGGSASGVASSPGWTITSTAYAVASAGDVDGNGYADVIVGNPGYSNGQSSEGRAYVYLGSATGLSTSAAWAVESNTAGAQFGSTVGTVGDVNGDGYSDVLVTAPGYPNGENEADGLISLYYGSSTGLDTSSAWDEKANQDGSVFGFCYTSGDINGDGYSDFVVGAPGTDIGSNDDAGQIFYWYGSDSGPVDEGTIEGDEEDAAFGISLASGDVDGDG